ncbi:MAG: ergothioneine biosynthesis protein EgtB, partial [Euryhalocaulis sp.]|uniref:ergothioneine biosynthesis protein EgtB n=1 Tax=Euryhalocaulis sp. TaxID=2744307 RepID=UPI0017C6B590
FNSYYEQVGERLARDKRGMISRPALDRVRDYRRHVDDALDRYLSRASSADFAKVAGIIELGMAHEQQHQELMLMDIKHVLSRNPLAPAAYPKKLAAAGEAGPMGWIGHEGGLIESGAGASGFSFDNEQPRHKEWLEPFEMADRPVTNADFAEFIADGGYDTATLWLADGWAWVNETGAKAPMYWREDGVFTLHGLETQDPDAPVCHLTYFEAEAYAEWAGANLPTEAQWEAAAEGFDPVNGDYMTPGQSAHPRPVEAGQGLRALSGGVWEWTRSAYSAYPGFEPFEGAAGEYNGKFMCGQYVMRGGCCATPAGHARRTYRNFFYPHMSWQFGGLRLARYV